MLVVMRARLIVVVIVAWCGVANAQIYSCQEGKRKVFSDQPCSSSAATVEVRPSELDKVPTGEAESAQSRLSAMEAENARLGYERLVRGTQQDLFAAEMRITELNSHMDVELGILRQQIQETTDDIEGTARKLALSREMEAVSQQYQNKMVEAAQKVQRIRESLARLVANPPDGRPPASFRP